MSPDEYMSNEPKREFMAKIARDLSKVHWINIQVDCQEDADFVFSKEYDFSVISRLLTLSQEQSIRVLLRVIEAQNIAPLFKDEPEENVMSEKRIMSFESCHFDFRK